MRILISSDRAGGVWDHSRTLAAALAQRGHAVLLALLGPLPASGVELGSGVELTAADLRLEWMPGGLDDVPRAASWLATLAERWRADVAHLNQLAPAAAARFPCPLVVAAHSDVVSWHHAVGGGPPGREWDAYARAVSAGLRAAAAVVTPSAHQSRLLRRHFRRGADRVVWNGAEPPPDAAGAPAAMERGDGRTLVVFAGRAWDAAKGAAVLDRALLRLGADAPRAVLLGALRGPWGEPFAPAALEPRGVVGRDEVHAWLRRADLVVVPSLYEPFGLVLLEAALHGRALLLSDLPSFRELWDGVAAFVPPGDDAALAGALVTLLRAPERRRAMGRAAWARARGRYGAARMARAYADLYEAVAARQGTGRGPEERRLAAAGSPR